jgi:hypothetical protein
MNNTWNMIKDIFTGLWDIIGYSVVGIFVLPVFGVLALLLGIIIIPVGIIGAVKEKRADSQGTPAAEKRGPYI